MARIFDIIVIIWMQSITKSIEINSFEHISLEYSRFSQTITPTHFLFGSFSLGAIVCTERKLAHNNDRDLFSRVQRALRSPVCFLTSRRIDANSSQFVHT